jgi:hypothetical protein
MQAGRATRNSSLADCTSGAARLGIAVSRLTRNGGAFILPDNQLCKGAPCVIRADDLGLGARPSNRFLREMNQYIEEPRAYHV